MRYEADLIQELCRSLGFPTAAVPDGVDVELDDGAVLEFVNADREDDSLVGFEGGQWHFHGDLVCSDGRSKVELGYLDLLTGLADGTVLICESWVGGELRDRSLVHRDLVDGFRFLEPGEEIRFRRARTRV